MNHVAILLDFPELKNRPPIPVRSIVEEQQDVLVWTAAPHGDARCPLWHADDANAADGRTADATAATGGNSAADATDRAASTLLPPAQKGMWAQWVWDYSGLRDDVRRFVLLL